MAASRRDVRIDRCLTRIVATVGPACSRPADLDRLVREGVSVFRLNLSHGDLETHARTITAIRRAAAALRTEVGILADLPGPKIRLTPMPAGRVVALRHGDAVRIARGNAPIDPDARPATLRVDYAGLSGDVRAGDRVLIDDGAVQLRVRRVVRGTVECTCEVGGTVSGRKGVNLPESAVRLRAPTARDRTLADWAVAHGADFVALSFVQRPADLRLLRRVLDAAARRRRRRAPAVVAKIERPVALGELDGIAAEADAMMVARGDLAIELDFARVPVEQRRIQAACERAAIPCIVATQMLQSMMEAPLPTRAEASDVANAILGGTDAAMLSGETAAGRHPFESVRAMRRIAQEAERWTAAQPPAPLRAIALAESPEPAAVLARAIAQMAADARARAVVCWTDARSVRFISHADVQVPIVAFGDDDAELRSLALLRGVLAVRTRRPADSRDVVRRAETLLRAARLVAAGDRIVVATGFAGHGTERLWLRRVGERTV
ncbi:MAG: pyruvate kinase [Phycisphaerales bacterium]